VRLIPAIDLRYGGVVRLSQGDDARRTFYDVDPAAMLVRCAAAGVDLVHVVDLDAAFGGAPQRELVAELVRVGPKLELGGGLRDRAAVEWALGAGCARVVLGSLVARDFATFREIATAFPGRVVPAVEVAAGELRIAGWRQTASMSLMELCRGLRGLPCPASLVTDVERDGTLEGPNYDLARGVAQASGLPALLSGGVRALADLETAVLFPEIQGVVVGKALYDGIFSLEAAVAACQGVADQGGR
jgi:phosphoribosylformimino-5-aminoimidazole carboxamide ribotide isomerase